MQEKIKLICLNKIKYLVGLYKLHKSTWYIPQKPKVLLENKHELKFKQVLK